MGQSQIFHRWGLAAAVTMSVAAGVWAQGAYTVSRKNLANVASFTVTQTFAVPNQPKVSTVYKVEVKGTQARLEYSDPSLGPVRYLSNKKGVFLYIASSKAAVKQDFKGGIDGALKVAFAEVNEQLKTARKVGSATVSGQPTTVYKDPKSGATLYIGTRAGYRLPVKTVLTNEGGSRTLQVTNIKVNPKIDNSRFDLPSGTQIVDSNTSGGGALGR